MYGHEWSEPECHSLQPVGQSLRSYGVPGPEDKVYVETRIDRVGNRSMGMSQRMVDAGTGDVHADSYGVLSTFDAALQKSFPMPEEWRKRLEAAD